MGGHNLGLDPRIDSRFDPRSDHHSQVGYHSRPMSPSNVPVSVSNLYSLNTAATLNPNGIVNSGLGS